jgi:hypothetical protein
MTSSAADKLEKMQILSLYTTYVHLSFYTTGQRVLSVFQHERNKFLLWYQNRRETCSLLYGTNLNTALIPGDTHEQAALHEYYMNLENINHHDSESHCKYLP